MFLVPASKSEHSNILIWRIPGLPTQGWKLSEDVPERLGDTKVHVSPFIGRATTFHAEGPLDAAELWPSIYAQNIHELADVHSDSKEAHIERVRAAVKQIVQNHLRKVVIARREDLEMELDYASTFQKLVDAYPQAIVYALFIEGRLWMGATPETLLTSDEHAIYTMALAGTRKPDGPEFTEKEYDEQLAVTESINDTLLQLGSAKVDAKGPEIIAAGPVQHLITRITAGLPNEGTPVDWAHSLHPTPAVCGMPKRDALSIIDALENFNRELYAGYLGWTSEENSRFYVNLRCMQVGQKRVALYAGGGITALSDPEAEWEETVIKLNTLKSVITQE
ncbi:MAG: isochorismate synthase [Bacteroidetes bacterium]|nr:MAG: isochorismate synthase [Bacteroidota bacterium]